MEDTNRVYRIRTKVGDDAPKVIHVPLNQTYDMFEILSLKLDQTNSYKSYESDYGVIVGRVMANGGFGVPNAKVSVFIEVSDDETLQNKLLYNFTSVTSTDNDGVRYNLLPDYVDDACHQNVGTFPNKRLVLDNNDVLETFDKYWKYTTTTNKAGDYMLFGIPTGSQRLHVDLDLSDCGILSQRPRDMMGKGYNATMFESPNKFKSSTNLNSLAQIISEDRSVYVYPYWGDVSDGEDKFAISRCDISLEYKFEPTAVFMGCIVTDQASNAIGKNCTGTEKNGKMSELIAGEGTIEMIRKTIDGKVEEFPIMGNRLIDGNGVWCYSIPMNLDYVTTDEFGNLVPTDDPNKGIATRARVRFRISLDENPNDASANKRARYLVPNNPRLGEGDFTPSSGPDFEFGSATREESYCDMFWNKVYTVKNYIPKLQKNSKETNRKHTGIKLINHYGDNNPMPYNALTIKLTFTYRLICILTKVVINLIIFLNQIITVLGGVLCLIPKLLRLPNELFDWMMHGLCIRFKVLGKRISICPFYEPMKILKGIWNGIINPIIEIIELIIPYCVGLSSDFCDDGVNRMTYYVGCGQFLFDLIPLPDEVDCVWERTEDNHVAVERKKYPIPEEYALNATNPTNYKAMLENCVENELAQSNDATSFNFYNDWINGTLYAPLWYRKITAKKSYFFGLFKKKAKDDWCSAEREFGGTRIIQHCMVERTESASYKNFDGKEIAAYYCGDDMSCGEKCHKSEREIKGMKGVIQPKTTMLGQTVYYYKPVEYDPTLRRNEYGNIEGDGEVKLLFATDIVLLGSLNECDMNGVPQFFKTLESTTYSLPGDILFTDYDFVLTLKEDGETERQKVESVDVVTTSEMAGCDWGNPNEFGKADGGLFYSIGCSTIDMYPKSCINLTRLCEYGVSLDETKFVPNLNNLENSDDAFERLVTDGYVSFDELYNLDERSMFATMNGNKLKTKLNTTNGLREYDFRYLYPHNFDGSLKKLMENRFKSYGPEVNYKYNYKLENISTDYYAFRMGNTPYYYCNKDVEDNHMFPRYENSFYFYFGLKAGKTAIEKFNSMYFAECTNPDTVSAQIGIKSKANSWCSMNTYVDYFNPSTEKTWYQYINFKEEGKNTYRETGSTETGKEYVDRKDETKFISAIVFRGLDDYGKKYFVVDDSKFNGYVAFDFSNIETPYDLLINSMDDASYSMEKSDIYDEKIYISNEDYKQSLGDDYEKLMIDEENAVPMLPNGTYQAVVTDGNGNITEFTFKIEEPYLTYKLNAQKFLRPNNVLTDLYGNRDNIASERVGLDDRDPQDIKRDIGGVVTLFDIYQNGEQLKDYIIEIKSSDGNYTGIKLKRTFENEQDKLFYYKTTPSSGWEPVVASTSGVYSKDDLLYCKLDGNDVFAFGLPEGGIEYVVKVTQICNGNESPNSVSTDVMVNSPTPFKMYINDIDYDLIKNFDQENNNEVSKFTGWKINDELVDKNYSNEGVAIDNVWFNIDNIYSYILSKDYSRFYVDESVTPFKIKYILNSDSPNTGDVDKHEFFEEFTKTGKMQDAKVYYDWIDDYIITGYIESDLNNFEKAESFVNSANNVLNLRKQLVTKMKNAFYLGCKNSDHRITVRATTDDFPWTATIAYHPEYSEEMGYENYLKDDSTEVNNISYIYNVNIPTISYKSSPDFGDGNSDDDAPCIAKSNGHLKRPYSVGVANKVQNTIPKELDCEVDDNVCYLDKDRVQTIKLFNFPLIDKIMDSDYIMWSAFVDLPKFGVVEPDSVTMNGLLAGYVLNGNVGANNEFEEQKLCGLKLKLSNNITNSTHTYIEKRYFNGYDYTDVVNNVLKYIKYLDGGFVYDNFLKDKIKECIDEADVKTKGETDDTKYPKFNSSNSTLNYKLYVKKYSVDDEIDNLITEGLFNSYTGEQAEMQEKYSLINYEDENIIEKLKAVKKDGVYVICLTLSELYKSVEGDTYITQTDYSNLPDKENFKNVVIDFYDLNDDNLKNFYNFTNYIVYDGDSENNKLQYSFVLPMTTQLVLNDGGSCGVMEFVSGNISVDLSDDSINDCRGLRDSKRILEVTKTDGTYYYIFDAGNNGVNYPINNAVKDENDFVWQITDAIKGAYDDGHSYNLFSFKTTTQVLINKCDKNFWTGEEDENSEEEDEELKNKEGYGNTGKFYPKSNKFYPVFIVSESDNHMRALSPVYDFSTVQGKIQYGTLHSVIYNEETAQTETNSIYVVGAAIRNNFHFLSTNYYKPYYFKNYSYILAFSLKYNNIDIKRDETTISEQRAKKEREAFEYAEIDYSTYRNLRFYDDKRNTSFYNEIMITAIDCTGLKHICKIESGYHDSFNYTDLYKYVWDAKRPNEDNECGFIYEGELTAYAEQIYAKDEMSEPITDNDIVESEKHKWKGWSEDVQDSQTANENIPIEEVTQPKYYCGNWVEMCKLTFNFNNETQEIRYCEKGVTLNNNNNIFKFEKSRFTHDTGFYNNIIGKEWQKVDGTDVNIQNLLINSDMIFKEKTS